MKSDTYDKLEPILENICDKICRYRVMCMSQDALDVKCAECKIAEQLANLLEEQEGTPPALQGNEYCKIDMTFTRGKVLPRGGAVFSGNDLDKAIILTRIAKALDIPRDRKGSMIMTSAVDAYCAGK